MSTKKIEGWIDDLSGNSSSEYALGNGAGYCDFWEGECPAVSQIHTRIATLVIHEWERERVYTESEVRAILHDMRSWISPDDGEEGRMWETRAKSHGIVLDPA